MSAVVAPPVAQYLIFLAASGRPPSTRRLRGEQLAHFWRTVGAAPDDLTEAQLIAWLGAQRWKPETLRSYRAALRGFYRWATDTGIVDTDPAAGLPRVPVVLPAPRPAPEAVWMSARARADPRVGRAGRGPGWGRMYIGRRLSAETSVDAADLEHLEVTVGIRAAYLLTGEGPALTRHPTLPGEPGNHRRRAKPGGLSLSGRAA